MNLAKEFIEKDKELVLLKKRNKNLIPICISLGVIFASFILFVFLIFDTNLPTSLMDDDEMDDFYFRYLENYDGDPTLNFINNLCVNSTSKTECVFDEIPLIWQEERKHYPVFKDFQSYFIQGGVCRDASQLRFVTLKSLDIPCYFNFSETNHVFLDCYEHGLHYQLNNQLLKIINRNI